MKKLPEPSNRKRLRKLSVVIPARNEQECIASTVEHLHLELRLNGIDHEIIVVDDGSTKLCAEALGVWIRVWISGLDQSLWCDGRSGSIRDAGSRNFFLLDQRSSAPSANAIHRL